MEEEYLDIVDSEDRVIKSELRSNLPKKMPEGSYLRYVNIFILNSKNELLIPKRSMNRRQFPGAFDFSCAEHVKSGESYLNAALRGLKEELGLENIELKEIGKITPKEEMSGFAMTYECIYNGLIDNYDKDGIDKLIWVKLEKVNEMLEKEKSKFKGDYVQNFTWYLKRRK